MAMQEGGEFASRSHPVREDMALQRTTWALQRAGWLLLAAVVVAALAGAFAVGPLGDGVATGGGGLEVRYGRFERSGASTRMELRVAAPAGPEVTLRLGDPFLEAFSIDAATPRPAAERSAAGGAELLFRVTPGTPLRVHLDLVPKAAGMVRSDIGLAGAEPARLTQFVYP